MNNESEIQGNPEPQTPSTLGAPEHQPEVANDSSPFEGKAESSNEFSFEDVVFGDNQSGTSEQPVETHADAKSQPPVEPVQTEEQPQTESNVDPNDANRYQYWQSQAMKAQNQLNTIQQQWGPIVQNATVNAQKAQANPNVQETEAEGEAFPDAPVKPTKPRGFSRADALEDPSSESARYLEDLDLWRDDIDDYNSLKAEYNTALVEEKMQKLQESHTKQLEEARRIENAKRQQQEIGNHVTSKYGMSAQEAADFVEWGNHPENLSMDNLVQLYKLQKGQGTAQTQGKVQPPSENFKQVQRAAQVPTPMGVVSGQSSTPQPKNPSDSLMDGLINYANKGDDIF